MRFVPNGFPGGFFLHVRREPATLDHETADHTVENCAVIKPAIGIVDEILDSDGGLVGVKLQLDVAQAGVNDCAGIVLRSEAWRNDMQARRTKDANRARAPCSCS